MLTEEQLNVNLLLYKKKLEGAINQDLSPLFNEIGDKLKRASFSLKEESGLAFEGSLIFVVLKQLTTLAVKINELQEPSCQVDKNTLVKVCLLQHLYKCIMFVKTTEEWRIKKGEIFTFNNLNTPLKGSLLTMFLCFKYDIKLTEEEIEAISSLDRDDEQIRYRSSPLSTLVRCVNDLILSNGRIKFINNKEEKNNE